MDKRLDVDSTILDQFRGLPDFPAFEALSHALWNDGAAAMIGAGFSRACKREKNSPTPPLWNDFKAEMAAALGYKQGREPDALRLAQEYRTLHGNNGLDKLINRMVADDQWEPGLLHEKLVQLPWRDILTTNWDTLLERTESTPDRIYSCVRTIQDIPHQRHPRIVKLHGSLPSHRPFIFTEDDYRTYPTQFAPFVNLAQQVMLEHDLCLIGFSGTDPNFLAWSGWVRDTLAISARKIRLVGVLKLSSASRALLEQRNVTPIDLEPLVSKIHPDEQHLTALRLFFSALEATKPPSPFTWNKGFPILENKSRTEIVKSWTEDRKRYPGWIVCPNGEIRGIINHCPAEQDSDTSAEASLRHAQESIWRDRIAGRWLLSQDMKNADQHFEDAAYTLSIAEKIELCASIAAEWRRYQRWDDWERWMARLETIGDEESALHHAYESAYRALLSWDDDEALKATNKLKSDEPIWMMRRAGLLALLFRYREAAELYQASLLLIRQKLLVAPKSAWLISLEAWASLSHKVSYPSLSDNSIFFPPPESEEAQTRYTNAKTDPWSAIQCIEKLTFDRIDRNHKERQQWKLSFKPGRYSPADPKFNFDNKCPFYSLLEIMERTGAPERIGNSTLFSSRLEAAFRAIGDYDENDLRTFFAQYRGGDIKVLDWIMPRMQVARLTDTAVELFISAIPQRIEWLRKLQINFELEKYFLFLLELLARIVIRAPSPQALATFEWATNIFSQSNLPPRWRSGCGTLLTNAIEAMQIEERQKAMELALYIKTPGETEVQRAANWPELFEEFSEEDVKKLTMNTRHSAQIDTLIELVENGSKHDRAGALRRLRILYKADKLTPIQSDSLESAIWTHCDPSRWPLDSELQPWVYQELPGKARANKLFLEKIVFETANGKIELNLLANVRNGLELLDPVPKELLISCVRSCLEWNPSPTTDTNSLARALSLSTEAATGREIGMCLAQSLLPRLSAADLPEAISEVLIQPEKLSHIPSLAATAFQIARLWPDQLSKACAQIRSAIASREPTRVYPTFTAIKQFIDNASSQSDIPPHIKELLLHACEQRTQPGLSPTLELLWLMAEKKLLNGEDLDRLIGALPVVLGEYRYDQKHLEVFAMAELPVIRKGVHRLIKLLADQNPDLRELQSALENDPLPEVRFLNDQNNSA